MCSLRPLPWCNPRIFFFYFLCLIYSQIFNIMLNIYIQSLLNSVRCEILDVKYYILCSIVYPLFLFVQRSDLKIYFSIFLYLQGVSWPWQVISPQLYSSPHLSRAFMCLSAHCFDFTARSSTFLMNPVKLVKSHAKNFHLTRDFSSAWGW